MLNFIIALLIALMPATYPESLVVTETTEHSMTCEPLGLYQSNDHSIEYIIHEAPEDIEVGDILSVTMDSQKTEGIWDDRVVNWQYSGYIF